jgi:hypothetical protein
MRILLFQKFHCHLEVREMGSTTAVSGLNKTEIYLEELCHSSKEEFVMTTLTQHQTFRAKNIKIYGTLKPGVSMQVVPVRWFIAEEGICILLLSSKNSINTLAEKRSRMSMEFEVMTVCIWPSFARRSNSWTNFRWIRGYSCDSGSSMRNIRGVSSISNSEYKSTSEVNTFRKAAPVKTISISRSSSLTCRSSPDVRNEYFFANIVFKD